MAKGITDLNQKDAENRAYVDPNLAGMSPRAAALVASSAARRGALPKYTTPTAGGAPPPIPALEQPFHQGMPMAAQAGQTMTGDSFRAQQEAFFQHGQREGGSILAPGGAPLGAVQRPPQLALNPNDVLPDEATKDPNYHQGASSKLAINQPHMAMKYGVVRGGQHIPPQVLMGTPMGPPRAPDDFRASMRRPMDETRNDLAQLAAAQQAPEDLTPPLKAPAREGAEAAARTGEVVNPPVLDAVDRDKLSAEVKDALLKMSDVDFDMLRRRMAEDILKNPKQREIVEARCTPLSIEELIRTNRVQQRVPIIPGQFEPTFESQTADVEMRLKQLLTMESDSVRITEAYLLDKYALMNTVAGVVAINNNRLPSMYDERGEFDDKKFWEKYNWMARKPMHMLASLGVHYSWFEARVRSLFKVEDAKNG
jgi:hypothetical protein